MDDTFLNLGFGSLLYELRSDFPESYETWNKYNSNLTSSRCLILFFFVSFPSLYSSSFYFSFLFCVFILLIILTFLCIIIIITPTSPLLLSALSSYSTFYLSLLLSTSASSPSSLLSSPQLPSSTKRPSLS
jgi:hypothetical protein